MSLVEDITRALDEDDTEHAALLLQDALADDLTDVQLLQLFEHLCARDPEPLALFPVDEQRPFTWVLRALVLHQEDRVQDASALLLKALASSPSCGGEVLLAMWLPPHPELDVTDLRPLLDALLDDVGATWRPRATLRFLLQRFVPLLTTVLRVRPAGLSDALLLKMAHVLWAAGEPHHAEAALEQLTDDGTPPARCMRLRLDDVDVTDAEGLLSPLQTAPSTAEEAETYVLHVRRAWGHVPDDALATALQEHAPQHPALQRMVSWLVDDSPTIRDKWGEHPNTDVFFAPDAAHHLGVPLSEAGARADEVFSTYGNTPDLPTHELRFSTMSAPSSLLALVHTYGGALPQNLSFVVEHIPNAGTSRDPRQVSTHHPTSSPEYTLWRYGGSKRQVPLPVPDIPDPFVQEQVGQLAARPYVRERWWAEAQALGADIGPDRVWDVLGGMVHLPDVPDDEPASPWVFRHQLAACMVLAHVDSGWRASTRRAVLCDLLFGVVDWACDAAALALTELALDEPVVSLDVQHWLELRLSDVADTPYVGLQRTLAECLLRFPGLGDVERTQLKQRLSSSSPTHGR